MYKMRRSDRMYVFVHCGLECVTKIIWGYLRDLDGVFLRNTTDGYMCVSRGLGWLGIGI